jgi:hypothetical protein
VKADGEITGGLGAEMGGNAGGWRSGLLMKRNGVIEGQLKRISADKAAILYLCNENINESGERNRRSENNQRWRSFSWQQSNMARKLKSQ